MSRDLGQVARAHDAVMFYQASIHESLFSIGDELQTHFGRVTMLLSLRIAALCALLCLGCDTAAKQQQAEAARRAATAAKLKQIGQALHQDQNNVKEVSVEATSTPAGK